VSEAFPQPPTPLSGDEAYDWVKTHTGRDIASASQRSFAEGWREAGISLSNELLRNIQRNTLGFYAHSEELAGLGVDDIIPRSWYYEGHELKMDAQFSYRFQVTLRNTETGAELKTYHNLASNDELPVWNAFAAMQFNLEASQGDQPYWEFVEGILIGALARPGTFG
jgi:hypothetical protein